MKNITNILNEFRECFRNIFNVYFLKRSNDIDFSEDLIQLEKDIFSLIVLSEFNKKSFKENYGNKYFPFFSVVQNVSSNIPIMVNRPSSDGNKYWDDEFKSVNLNMHFRFIGFFDWDDNSFKEFKYIKVKIVKFNDRPDLVGRDALVEASYFDIFYNDSDEGGA